MKPLILILIAVFLFSSAGFAVDNASDNMSSQSPLKDRAT
jgi:hypothetical protein